MLVVLWSLLGVSENLKCCTQNSLGYQSANLKGSIKSALSLRAGCIGTISDAYAVPRKALFQVGSADVHHYSAITNRSSAAIAHLLSRAPIGSRRGARVSWYRHGVQSVLLVIGRSASRVPTLVVFPVFANSSRLECDLMLCFTPGWVQ
jgi:hypothetical protein